MHRISATLAVVAVIGAGSPCYAQNSDAPGFGSLVGGLVGGAIGAAIDGRAPRAGDLVPGGGGKSKGKAGSGGQHGHGSADAMAQRSPAHAGGGQGAPVHRKPGK